MFRQAIQHLWVVVHSDPSFKAIKDVIFVQLFDLESFLCDDIQPLKDS